jgi:hypothetical protein
MMARGEGRNNNVREGDMRETIRKIADNEALFYDNDWYLGSDMLVAVHGKDKSTEDKIRPNHILCSFRGYWGRGKQFQMSIPGHTELGTMTREQDNAATDDSPANQADWEESNKPFWV